MARQKARTREFRKKKNWKERRREGGEEERQKLEGRGQSAFRTYRGAPLREIKL